MFWASIQGQKPISILTKIKNQYQEWEEQKVEMDLTNSNSKLRTRNLESENCKLESAKCNGEKCVRKLGLSTITVLSESN